MTRRFTLLGLSLSLILFGFGPAMAAPPPTFNLVIHDHGFEPQSLTIPAHTRVKLRVKNARRLPSEFESFELNREKVVPGGTTVNVWIGPLKPGKYKVFDDFNPGVKGWIIVNAPQTDTQP